MTKSTFDAPYELTIGEGFVNPQGFHSARPTYSWKLPASVKKQTAYQIKVTSNSNNWDCGWVESDQSLFIPHGGADFVSRAQANWQVRFRDENSQESPWSERAYFEIGLLSDVDWQASWISAAEGAALDYEPVTYLERTFPYEDISALKQARIYAAAKGIFEIYLNGKRVNHDHFANGWTAYTNRLDTLTYDATPYLQTGSNTLKVLLGTGWYAGRLPFNAQKRGPYGTTTELLLQLEITGANGTRQIITSDEAWKSTFTGPIISSSFYDGEIYDARITSSVWKPVAVNAELGSARLTPKPFPTVQETETLHPQAMTEPIPGHFIFDLGQNMVGWTRIKIPVQQGETVTVHFAEMLHDDGTIYTENYRAAKSTDTYTAAQSGYIEWEPHFTFHGFRYVELSGLPANVTPQKSWVEGVVLHSHLRQIGNFTSSHPKLNQLQSNIKWGWRGNSVDIPTDCPQRDERCGWTGDAQVFCPTAMFNYDSLAFWKSWLGSMRDEQDDDGVIPDIIPTANLKMIDPGRQKSPGWMDAAVFIPWDVYVRSGDVSVLSENYEMMKHLVAWYRNNTTEGGIVQSDGGYGDWLQPHSRREAADRRGDTPMALLRTAFYARDVQLLAQVAHILGHDADAISYEKEAGAVCAAFRGKYFCANGKIIDDAETQTAYALAISFDLLPPKLRQKAGEHLARLVEEADGHLRTGFLGTPHLTHALDITGFADLACEVLFKETYPSWFYSINQGATTMWERWNSYSHENGFGDAGMNSFNHYAYGAIGQWMYERIAGLMPDPAYPGYKHFFVHPLTNAPLDFAHAELETAYGHAVSAWKREADKVVLHIVVPPNCTATVEFPDERAPQTLSAGEYTL